jgi:hypothetical protein
METGEFECHLDGVLQRIGARPTDQPEGQRGFGIEAAAFDKDGSSCDVSKDRRGRDRARPAGHQAAARSGVTKCRPG